MDVATVVRLNKPIQKITLNFSKCPPRVSLQVLAHYRGKAHFGVLITRRIVHFILRAKKPHFGR